MNGIEHTSDSTTQAIHKVGHQEKEQIIVERIAPGFFAAQNGQKHRKTEKTHKERNDSPDGPHDTQVMVGRYC